MQLVSLAPYQLPHTIGILAPLDRQIISTRSFSSPPHNLHTHTGIRISTDAAGRIVVQWRDIDDTIHIDKTLETAWLGPRPPILSTYLACIHPSSSLSRPPLYLSSSLSRTEAERQPRNSGTRRPIPMDRYFFSIGETRRILEEGGGREGERVERLDRSPNAVNSSLNCHRLSIPYRGRFFFSASVAKCLDTRFEIEACFFLFPFSSSMGEREFFEKFWGIFLILLPCFFSNEWMTRRSWFLHTSIFSFFLFFFKGSRRGFGSRWKFLIFLYTRVF